MNNTIINEFWDYFQEMHSHLVNEEEQINEDIHFELSEKLKEMKKDLCLEINLTPRQIIISADGVEDVFEAVEAIYDMSPRLASWEIIKYRQPIEDIENQTLQVGDYIIKFSDILYDLVMDEEAGIVVIMFIPGYEPENPVHEMLKWVILDKTIGEYDAATKIGYFDTYSTDEISNLDEDISATFKSLKSLKEDLHNLSIVAAS